MPVRHQWTADEAQAWYANQPWLVGCNYIPSSAVESLEPEVARFEPRRALSGGVDGLDCYRRLVPDVARLLKPGATAVVEVGAGQAARVSAILAGHGLHPVAIQADLSGIERCLIATPHVD